MNQQTISASYKIEKILDTLVSDGDIDYIQLSRIMRSVNTELKFEDNKE